MWKGNYKKLNPISDYAGMRFDLDAVHDDWDGFRLWFRPYDVTKGMLIIKFKNQLFYSSSAENDRLDGAENEIAEEFPHLFWEVSNSDLIHEFVRQSAGVRAGDIIRHYCFIGCNQAVDVLSIEPPKYSGYES